MPDNNEPQYELDHDYEPFGIVDAADGSGTTWPEFVGQVNKMDNQVAALTEDRDSRFQCGTISFSLDKYGSSGCGEYYEIPIVNPYGRADYTVFMTMVGTPSSWTGIRFAVHEKKATSVIVEVYNEASRAVSGSFDWMVVF